MAKLDCLLDTSIPFGDVVEAISTRVLDKSMSSSMEEEQYAEVGSASCAIRTLERYSFLGGSRVSMTIVFLTDQDQPQIHIMGSTSGGGQGLVKIIPWGENEFLYTLKDAIDEYAEEINSRSEMKMIERHFWYDDQEIR